MQIQELWDVYLLMNIKIVCCIYLKPLHNDSPTSNSCHYRNKIYVLIITTENTRWMWKIWNFNRKDGTKSESLKLSLFFVIKIIQQFF